MLLWVALGIAVLIVVSFLASPGKREILRLSRRGYDEDEPKKRR